ncbi:MAG: DNA ligase (ATP) [Stictis urceolatum]|nr:DNA ligase (ATP) [Stictis urceolata]
MADREDTQMPDAPGASSTSLTETELDEKLPNRPRNQGKTLAFHELFLNLFNPLNENKKPTGPVIARKKQGPHGPHRMLPHEVRRNLIERFISRWRNEVGNDIYPAFRLILPDKDRDRAMYGLKEKAIGKLLVKVMRIDKNSEDGYDLLNWKLPGQTFASRMAGDFAGRCGEIIRKRPMRTAPGNMTIEEVNTLLDKLSAEQKEEGQMPIFQTFYQRMNADEMMWLMRIILRQMKVGATERTFFDIWHPDATSLFNVSSSLRRVCWELYDPNFRLDGEKSSMDLMQCFQPQLAQFQMHSFQKMVEKMRPVENDIEFWVEEKLDGERMQMHMVSDDQVPGGRRFAFWSRKAKDYTHLYGNGLHDDNSALTRHLKNAFAEKVESIILDGEMITWDPEQDAMVPFGSLKTAALAGQRNPFSETEQRPLFRVFDILLLNGHCLTEYTLRDRRHALEESVKSVPRRLEIHTYRAATTAKEIDDLLRVVVSEASEGLVLKNPRSAYNLNQRNDDWMKVKPEYMTEFGENLDIIIIGGYYGSGRRGGRLSSFLCGLRVDENHVRQGANPAKCYSFVKVGGGMTANDYASIQNQLGNKWKDWNQKRPPTEFIELAGGSQQIEKPDVWIRPDESIVISVKASQVTMTDTFRTGFTLRFPRFKSIRSDRDWKSALSLQGFTELKSQAETEHKEKKFEVDNARRKRARISKKKPITVMGSEEVSTPYAGESTNAFEGLTFYVMSESLSPEKKSKPELEQMIKANGGKIIQNHTAVPNTLCIADRNLVKVAALVKRGETDLIRPAWLFDCIKQSFSDRNHRKFIIPLEPKHMFFITQDREAIIAANSDEYGDSYARDTSVDELRQIIDSMADIVSEMPAVAFRPMLAEHGHSLPELRGWLFEGLTIHVDQSISGNGEGPVNISALGLRLFEAGMKASFAAASISFSLKEGETTHIVFPLAQDMDDWTKNRLKAVRKQMSSWQRLPRVVSVDWIEESWNESTLIDEERFAIVL